MKARIYSGNDLVAMLVDVNEEKVYSVAEGIKALYPKEVCKLQIGKISKVISLPLQPETFEDFVGLQPVEKLTMTRKAR